MVLLYYYINILLYCCSIIFLYCYIIFRCRMDFQDRHRASIGHTFLDICWFTGHHCAPTLRLCSISKNEKRYHQSTQRFVNIKDTQGTQVLEVESFQIAYTMGGASIRYATTDVSNAAYQTTNMYDKDARVISVSLAF